MRPSITSEDAWEAVGRFILTAEEMGDTAPIDWSLMVAIADQADALQWAYDNWQDYDIAMTDSPAYWGETPTAQPFYDGTLHTV